MNIADRIYEAVKSMPEQQAAEVLDFAEFLQAKTGCSRQETGLTKREYFATAALQVTG